MGTNFFYNKMAFVGHFQEHEKSALSARAKDADVGVLSLRAKILLGRSTAQQCAPE